MNILKEMLNEIFLKSGIYDSNGNFIKSIYGSDRLDKNGNKDIDKNYLLANNTIKYLKNGFNNKEIDMDFFKYVLDNNNTKINPVSGYLIDKYGKKSNLYSYNRLINIIARKDSNGNNVTYFKNGKQFYMMNSIYEKYISERLSKNKKIDNTEDDYKWEINKSIRARYDPDENK